VPLALTGCVQAPPLHTSLVQGLPSSVQAAVLLGRWHTPPTHVSVVQGLLSLQAALDVQPEVVPAQTPVVHRSFVVSELPSLHTDPLGSLVVQASAVSLQVSEQSESPSAPGHGLPA